jgi:pyruvate,water dikinase
MCPSRPGSPRVSWFRRFLRDRREERQAELEAVRRRFASFSALLDANKRVLEVLADMEEKSQGEHLFDINYVRSRCAEIRSGVDEIVDQMIALGGERYAALRERHGAVEAEIDALLEGQHRVPEDAYTIPFDQLDRSRADSVGGKSAQLGELKSRLGLPVPEGFAISAWAYKRFVDANDLQSRITGHVRSLDARRLEDLERASGAIQEMVAQAEVPSDLARALTTAARELEARSGSSRFALRSSALGEDALLSFAGQYATALAVARDDLLCRYRQVLAGKFSPRAIYYLLSHDLQETDLAMGVACVAMVDAVASGVAYSRDPLRPDETHVLVHSVFGLGELLVDGTLTPDLFRVAREDGRVVSSTVARKPEQLVLRADGTIEVERVPDASQEAPSLDATHLATLCGHAARLEGHYGGPQDIEWALDRRGRLVLLQARPLRVFRTAAGAAALDVSGLPVLRAGGTTVCCGASAGAVFKVTGPGDLERVPEGAVVVSAHPFPALVTVMGRASAIVTEVGGVASHMATLAREYRVPTLAGIREATAIRDGERVTVDATGGCVYAGEHPDLAEVRRPEHELFEDTAIFELLERVLARVVPLNLLHPGAPDFRPEGCRTLHDIARFAHQKAMEEMFSGALETGRHHGLGLRLHTDIPLDVRLIEMDAPADHQDGKRRVAVEDLRSVPFQAFWEGVEEVGWPAYARPVNLSGFVSVVTTQMGTGSREDFGEASFALLSARYMLLSLHLGYHFTTFEALCTPEPSKNFIRMQFKGGGAAPDRRLRRIRLVMDLLTRMGFEHASRGDFLDTRLSYADEAGICHRLRLLGRLTMLTKQLDMALSNDEITRWYVKEFAAKLGLEPGGAQT